MKRITTRRLITEKELAYMVKAGTLEKWARLYVKRKRGAKPTGKAKSVAERVRKHRAALNLHKK